jgi:hypothetical protein
MIETIVTEYLAQDRNNLLRQGDVGQCRFSSLKEKLEEAHGDGFSTTDYLRQRPEH